MCTKKLLLLDLDGVMVAGERTGRGGTEELRLLHPELPDLLIKRNFEIILFTHRAYADAQAIRKALHKMGVPILHCISAREMLLSALKQTRFIELLLGGLSKKYGVASVVQKYGASVSGLTLIDDRVEILNEVLAEGIGQGLHAPFEVQHEQLISFDFAQAIKHLDAIHTDQAVPISLVAVKKSISDLPVIISISANTSTKLSLLVRKLIRKTRQLVKNIRG